MIVTSAAAASHPESAARGYNKGMARSAAVPVEEYLRTDYEPDCDYVDGEIRQRNVGERDHGEPQGEIYTFFKLRSRTSRIYPFLEQRIRISPTRFRVPDICLVAGARPAEQVFTSPPLVAIEILSPEDRLERLREKIDDYLGFGIRYVWLIDPRMRRAWICTSRGMEEAKDGVLRTEEPAVELPLPEIFAALDSLE